MSLYSINCGVVKAGSNNSHLNNINLGYIGDQALQCHCCLLQHRPSSCLIDQKKPSITTSPSMSKNSAWCIVTIVGVHTGIVLAVNGDEANVPVLTYVFELFQCLSCVPSLLLCQLTALEVAEDELTAMSLAYLLGNVTPRYQLDVVVLLCCCAFCVCACVLNCKQTFLQQTCSTY